MLKNINPNIGQGQQPVEGSFPASSGLPQQLSMMQDGGLPKQMQIQDLSELW